jgi:ferredoxin
VVWLVRSALRTFGAEGERHAGGGAPEPARVLPVPPRLRADARETVRACPKLALRLER